MDIVCTNDLYLWISFGKAFLLCSPVCFYTVSCTRIPHSSLHKEISCVLCCCGTSTLSIFYCVWSVLIRQICYVWGGMCNQSEFSWDLVYFYCFPFIYLFIFIWSIKLEWGKTQGLRAEQPINAKSHIKNVCDDFFMVKLLQWRSSIFKCASRTYSNLFQ